MKKTILLIILVGISFGLQAQTFTTNQTPVGMEHNVLFNADKNTNKIKVTQTGSTTFNLNMLFDGKFAPSYTAKGVSTSSPTVILIEGLPSYHTQKGAWVGWSTRYWQAKRFKIEGYNVYGRASNSWVTIADYSTKNYSGSNFTIKLPSGAYTKLKYTFYESHKSHGRIGVSELFYIHPEAVSPYQGLMSSSNSGNSGYWNSNSTDVYYPNGKVGIGTSSPSEKLEVDGNIQISGKIITGTGENISVGNPNEVLSINDAGKMEWKNMPNNSNAYTGVYEINSGFVYKNTPSNYGTILISNPGPTLITGINPGVHGQKITIHVKSPSSTLVLKGDDDNTIENKKIHIQELENSASLDGKNSISLIEGNSATLMYDTNINKWRLIDRNINFDISGKQLALYENGKIKNSPVKISKDDNLFIGMPEAFEVPHKVNVNGSINATGLFVNGNPVDGSIDGMVIENNPGTKTVEMKLTQGVQDQYFLQAYYDNTVSGGGITSIQGTKQNSGKISLSKMNNTSLIELGHSGNSNQMTIVYGELCVSTDQSSCDVPDYVFEDDYDLMPIKDVATFIKKNKHLPNVPSEKEIKEKGKLDMMSFSYKLLEKVEELTLYTIDQENRLKKLDDLVTKQAELIEKLLKK